MMMRTLIASVFALGVNATASAQLGGLVNKAKKAAKGVVESTVVGTNSNSSKVGDTYTDANTGRSYKVYDPNTATPNENGRTNASPDRIEMYKKHVIEENYLLNDLKEANPYKEHLDKFKPELEDYINETLKPDKILATISTTDGWNGVAPSAIPGYKDTYSAAKEVRFKTFYEKGGKYYVVEGIFREVTPTGDGMGLRNSEEDDNCWPGLKPEVEIPADKIKKLL